MSLDANKLKIHPNRMATFKKPIKSIYVSQYDVFLFWFDVINSVFSSKKYFYANIIILLFMTIMETKI